MKVKMTGLKKLKIFLVFVISLAIYNYVDSQNNCNLNNAISSGYLESPIFDLGNSYNLTKISWQGERDNNHFVGFQIASSISSSGPWIFYGPDFSNDYIDINPYQIYSLNNKIHQGIRYLKYKILLASCNEFSSPRVDKIIIYFSK
ncbi:MAG: hypothetical protein KatS3mg094_380 [Candidatus Parcubacteria bacterium]|nr:MAG: hypothetical protein KatS3mg094_380 [Candidatus Parcubacteria bacterium]